MLLVLTVPEQVMLITAVSMRRPFHPFREHVKGLFQDPELLKACGNVPSRNSVWSINCASATRH